MWGRFLAPPGVCAQFFFLDWVRKVCVTILLEKDEIQWDLATSAEDSEGRPVHCRGIARSTALSPSCPPPQQHFLGSDLLGSRRGHFLGTLVVKLLGDGLKKVRGAIYPVTESSSRWQWADSPSPCAEPRADSLPQLQP